MEPLPSDLMPAPVDDDLLAAAVDDHHSPDPGRRVWTIEDDGAAEWAGRRLARHRREIGDAEAQAEEWRAQITAWLLDRTHGEIRSAAFLESALIDYGRRMRTEDRKTITLPSATISTRAPRTSVEVVDEELFVEWARREGRDDLLRVTPDKVTIKARLVSVQTEDDPVIRLGDPDTGEVVPGVVVTVGDVSVTVQTR